MNPSDARIAAAVRRELAADPAVDPARVRVHVEGGVVELQGNVPFLSMADAAVSRAEMVHGVRSVVDLLSPERVNRGDRMIESEVRETLDLEPATASMELAPRVIDGVVTLRGSVSSFAHAQLAEEIARSVRGVHDVVSQLAVEPAARADSEVLSDVQAALRADRLVDEWLLEATVQNGVVNLRGVQPTAAGRRRALEVSWVAGVRDVDATDLLVRPELTSEQRRPPAGYAYPTDAEIARSISAVIARAPELAGRAIGVVVGRGVATLNGRVRTLAARTAAEEKARSVQGVWEVRNLVEVEPSGAADSEIHSGVERMLALSPPPEADQLDVTVRDAVVTLRGAIGSMHARRVVEQFVSRVPGVRGIQNEVAAPERPRPPDDAALLQDVLARLEYNPYVDAEQIDVQVAGGQVLLRGRVHDRRAAREAMRSAHEAGARDVLDGLQVMQ